MCSCFKGYVKYSIHFFRSPGGMNFNNYVWGQNGSSGGGTSTPSTRSDHNSTSYGSLERTKPSDYGWGEPHYNDSSADSSGYGAETTPGFDSLLSSTPEANNPGWSRNLTREFEQEATKAPSTAGQTQFYGGGPAKRQDERDHIFGALPTGGTEHAPFDMMDGGGPQKLPGFETGVSLCIRYLPCYFEKFIFCSTYITTDPNSYSPS